MNISKKKIKLCDYSKYLFSSRGYDNISSGKTKKIYN